MASPLDELAHRPVYPQGVPQAPAPGSFSGSVEPVKPASMQVPPLPKLRPSGVQPMDIRPQAAGGPGLPPLPGAPAVSGGTGTGPLGNLISPGVRDYAGAVAGGFQNSLSRQGLDAFMAGFAGAVAANRSRRSEDAAASVAAEDRAFDKNLQTRKDSREERADARDAVQAQWDQLSTRADIEKTMAEAASERGKGDTLTPSQMGTIERLRIDLEKGIIATDDYGYRRYQPGDPGYDEAKREIDRRVQGAYDRMRTGRLDGGGTGEAAGFTGSGASDKDPISGPLTVENFATSVKIGQWYVNPSDGAILQRKQ